MSIFMDGTELFELFDTLATRVVMMDNGYNIQVLLLSVELLVFIYDDLLVLFVL